VLACEIVGGALRPHLRDDQIPEVPTPGVCCVTGRQSVETIDRSRAILPSMTQRHLLRAPSSNRVSLEVFAALTHPWERKSSWWCSGSQFSRLTRQGARRMILDAPQTPDPWCGYVTTSYKKHGCLLAPVNEGATANRWLWEETIVDCSDRSRARDWDGRLRLLFRSGFRRADLLHPSVAVPGAALSRNGLLLWTGLLRWMCTRCTDPLYQFLVFLLPARKRADLDDVSESKEDDHGTSEGPQDEKGRIEGKGRQGPEQDEVDQTE